MKIITLLPVKNEDWILEHTLKNLSSFSDHIIIADQSSTDDTLDICKRFEKVKVINNPNTGPSNMIRWLLLDEARKISGDNLIFCIDVDEMVSPKLIYSINEIIKNRKLKPGIGFSFSWIQLWNSTEFYRIDGVWKNNIKSIAFWDDRKINYKKERLIIDHTSRIPEVKETVFVKEYPLLHLQSISENRYKIKQAWYRCYELINNKNNPQKINLRYSVADIKDIITSKTDGKWFDGIDIINYVYDKKDDWRYKEILEWFDKYGIEFFEPLEIWHIKELHDIFVEKKRHEPKTENFPKILIALNNVKNKIKNLI